MHKNDALTKEQRELVDAIIRYNSLKRAAEELHISYVAPKQLSCRIGSKYRLASEYLKKLDKIGFRKITARIPACQTCKLLDIHGFCKHSNARIDVNAFDPQCALWQLGELNATEVLSRDVRIEGEHHVHL